MHLGKFLRFITVSWCGLFAMQTQAQGPVTSTASDVLRFAAEPFPPFVIDEGGRAGGALVDVVLRVCAAAKRNCTVEILPFRRLFASAMLGTSIDGVIPSRRVPEREAAFNISDPVVKSAYSFFVPIKSNWHYTGAADLNGMTVAAYGPSVTSNTVQEVVIHTSARVEIEVDNSTVLKKMFAGRYGESAAVVMSRETGIYLLNELKIGELKTAGDLKQFDYCFALSKKSSHAGEMEALNTALHELQKSGEIKTILGKYALQPSDK